MDKTTLVFDNLASNWDEKHAYIEDVYGGESERLLKCIPEYLKDGMRVADLGCGTGKVTEHILKSGKNVEITAVDASSQMLEIANSKFGGYDNVSFIHSGLEEFEDEEGFDIIFLLQVIHHISEPERAISHIVDLLKPNGKLILLVIGEEHMRDIAPYEDEGDILGRFSKEKLISLFELDSLSICKIYDDSFKLKFKDSDDVNNFMDAVSLAPKMNGYENIEHDNLAKNIECNGDGSLTVNGHHYTLIYERVDDSKQLIKNYKESVISAYDTWSYNYSDVVLDKLERRGYSYDKLAELINNLLSVKPGEKVLEIGAGTGLVGKRIREKNQGIELDCVEISSLMASKIPTDTYNEITITDFENCYSTQKKYECVYTTFMMHHAYSIGKVLEKINSVMTENGTLVVVDLLLNEEEAKDFNNEMHSNIHEYGAGVNYFTREKFEDALISSGFVIEKVGLLGSNVGLFHWMFVAKRKRRKID